MSLGAVPMKPGSPNPRVSLWVVDLTGDLKETSHTDVKPPDVVKDQLVKPAVWFVVGGNALTTSLRIVTSCMLATSYRLVTSYRSVTSCMLVSS